VALILFPLLGSLVYIIVRGMWLGTGEDVAARAQLSRSEFERRERGAADPTASGPGGST
jgi:hypothetical protein